MSRAVTLEGVTCDGADRSGGCGRSCALVFKDEWLEPATEPGSVRPPQPRAVARVRSVEEILATLGVDGRLDGISPHPEMLALVGRRFPVARMLDLSREGPPAPRDDWFILDGVRCDGTVLGAAGPCDRRCALLWHRSWIELEHHHADDVGERERA